MGEITDSGAEIVYPSESDPPFVEVQVWCMAREFHDEYPVWWPYVTITPPVIPQQPR